MSGRLLDQMLAWMRGSPWFTNSQLISLHYETLGGSFVAASNKPNDELTEELVRDAQTAKKMLSSPKFPVVQVRGLFDYLELPFQPSSNKKELLDILDGIFAAGESDEGDEEEASEDVNQHDEGTKPQSPAKKKYTYFATLKERGEGHKDLAGIKEDREFDIKERFKSNDDFAEIFFRAEWVMHGSSIILKKAKEGPTIGHYGAGGTIWTFRLQEQAAAGSSLPKPKPLPKPLPKPEPAPAIQTHTSDDGTPASKKPKPSQPAVQQDLCPQPKGAPPKFEGIKAGWNSSAGMWEVTQNGETFTKLPSAKGWTQSTQQQEDGAPQEDAPQEDAAVQQSTKSKGKGKAPAGKSSTVASPSPRFLLDTVDDGLLGPITGVMDAPLLPLTKAAAKTGLPNIDSHAFIASEKAEQMAKEGSLGKLTKEEAGALTLYTMEALYGPLNVLLRQRDRNKLKPYFPYLRLLLQAKDKLPKYSGAVWRGVKGKDLSSDFPKGNEVWWWAFNSTTKDLMILQNPLFLGKSGKRTQFMIEQRNGIDISPFSMYPEDEVLLFPGTKLRVKSSASIAPGLIQIHLEEVDVDTKLMK